MVHYARLTYDFVPLPENSQILYEPGAHDLAKLVDANLALSLGLFCVVRLLYSVASINSQGR